MRAISISRKRQLSGQASLPSDTFATPSVSTPHIISGLANIRVRAKIHWKQFQILRNCYKNPLDWFGGLHYLLKLRRSILGKHRIRKMVEVGGLYYTDIYIPGWNDPCYNRFVATQLACFKPHQEEVNRLNQVFLAITKKCPLQCEHCSAWDTLNMKDFLGAEDFQRILEGLYGMGISQVYFTGGEPLIKIRLLESLISRMPKDVKSWIATSGYRLSREKAHRLKKAGLTGIFVSLDHYEAERHNAFRNHDSAYTWAIEAVQKAHQAGLAVAFSICLSNEMCREVELLKYMEFARQCGVHFVQFLEPQAVGRYINKKVSLTRESIESAEALYLKMNFGKDYLDYPIIHYIGYYHRRVGCLAGGKQVIYIDADGNLNSCPFCQKNYGNLKEGGVREKVDAMAATGCVKFEFEL